MGLQEGFGLLIWCRIYNLSAMFQRVDLGCVCAGKGNEVKLGENSAAKEASTGPPLRGEKPLAAAIALTGAPARARVRQPLGAPPSEGWPFNPCPGNRGIKGSEFREAESTVQPEGKRATGEYEQVQQVLGSQRRRSARKQKGNCQAGAYFGGKDFHEDTWETLQLPKNLLRGSQVPLAPVVGGPRDHTLPPEGLRAWKGV